MDSTCQEVTSGDGPAGATQVHAVVVASGLEVPWSLGFLPGDRMLLTERPGRVRLIENGALLAQPVATLNPMTVGESGLLGLAVDPQFDKNRFIYLYVSGETQTGTSNRVERWKVGDDFHSAELDKIILAGINGAQFHDGGRLRFGPDGFLYIGTGDGRQPDRAQSLDELAGKILRVTRDGDVPADNPWPGKAAFVMGVRNTEGFDWFSAKEMVMTDHGPSGELNRTGHDEVNVVKAGDNLGWPTIFGCQAGQGLVTPRLTWTKAVPPGGAALYTSDEIPEWKGSLLIGVLGATHLHRVVFSADAKVASHEVYFSGTFGRLREVVMGPDGHLYVTTSNCDGRGSCGADKDAVLKVLPGP
jgi:glucose/arabinose dehydrogenase